MITKCRKNDHCILYIASSRVCVCVCVCLWLWLWLWLSICVCDVLSTHTLSLITLTEAEQASKQPIPNHRISTRYSRVVGSSSLSGLSPSAITITAIGSRCACGGYTTRLGQGGSLWWAALGVSGRVLCGAICLFYLPCFQPFDWTPCAVATSDENALWIKQYCVIVRLHEYGSLVARQPNPNNA